MAKSSEFAVFFTLSFGWLLLGAKAATATQGSGLGRDGKDQTFPVTVQPTTTRSTTTRPTTTTTVKPSTVTTAPPPQGPPGNLTPGEIAGIVIAVILFYIISLMLVAILVFYLTKRGTLDWIRIPFLKGAGEISGTDIEGTEKNTSADDTQEESGDLYTSLNKNTIEPESPGSKTYEQLRKTREQNLYIKPKPKKKPKVAGTKSKNDDDVYQNCKTEMQS